MSSFQPMPHIISIRMAEALPYHGRQGPNPANRVQRGVTSYGRSTVGEDYAEAQALYRMGIVGYAIRPGGSGYEPVWFRDIFPERAAIFDEIYPTFAAEQLAQIARERRPRRTRAPRTRAARAVTASVILHGVRPTITRQRHRVVRYPDRSSP